MKKKLNEAVYRYLAILQLFSDMQIDKIDERTINNYMRSDF